jgi:glutamine synthetase
MGDVLMENQLQSRLVKEGIGFIVILFVDIAGRTYMMEIMAEDLEHAYHGGIGFDGSSGGGFRPVNNSDLALKASASDLRIYQIDPNDPPRGIVIADVIDPQTGEPIQNAPRYILKRALAKLKEELDSRTGVLISSEVEFILLAKQNSTYHYIGEGEYCAPPPLDEGFKLREHLSKALSGMGVKVGKNHHEVSPGKHEINLDHTDALTMADILVITKYVIRNLAAQNDLIATFMPKPFHGEFGLGMHTHLSLVNEQTGDNLFFDSRGKYGLSETALHFLGGLLTHAPALAAVTNPSVNSYKRIVPGWEAPVNISWGKSNRSTLIRVPTSTPNATHIEYRPTEGTCNFYLAYSAMLYAGVDGIKNKIMPPEPIEESVYAMDERTRQRLGIRHLPGTLQEALQELEKDAVIKDSIAPVYDQFLELKTKEWEEYCHIVHPWEREKYLYL